MVMQAGDRVFGFDGVGTQEHKSALHIPRHMQS